MKSFKPYHPARTTTGIIRDLVLKLVIILIVMILVQLNACVAEAGSLNSEISHAFFGYSVLMRKGPKRKKMREHQTYPCLELVKMRKKRKTNTPVRSEGNKDTKRAGLGVG
jgi:hypothetical protein